MRIEAGLYSRLSGYAGLTALTDARIYPIRLPQPATFPAVTYQRVSRPRIQTMGTNPGLVYPRFQIDCWAKTYDSANDVAAQVIAALENQLNTTWGGDAGVTIQAAIVEDDMDFYEPEVDIYRVMIEVVIWHAE